MRFGVLGPLAVWTAGGEPVAVPGVKVRALLADLLVHQGRPVPAGRLVEDLWEGRPPGNPLGALSAKVSQLRRALEDAEPGGRELVVSGPSGYALRADPAAVDAHRFQELTARARRTADPRDRAALLSGALALWRGPAFADFADAPFTRVTIARLEEQRLAAREDEAEARLALGEHATLAAELGDLLAEHPLRERLRAAHMRALYGAGRQSEALDSYAALRAHLAEELGLDPGAELAALHQAILTQDPALATPAPPAARPATNLSAPLTELIGRDDAVAEIGALLESDRLVTLTGPGGVGKTRLAVETATRLADERAAAFADGVWLVELAGFDRPGAADPMGSLADLALAVLAVRDTADAGEPVTPVDRLCAALRARRVLLVLDNCEHVIEYVAELAAELLRAAPGLRILATGREPLALPGEVVWSVPPLEVPDPAGGADPETLRRFGAVRLFVARASAAARGFALDQDEETARAVAVLCRRLDGIPLALELAATRVRALGVRGLVSRLDDRFRLLATGHRGAPPRQQTLMAMIDWSWELLSDPERAALRRLAVHGDGCTLDAAEAVCGGDGLSAEDVPDLLARLVDRSLVVVARAAEGPRYRLLESVAAYCVERLHEAGEFERAHVRHRRYYTELAETADAHLRGHDQRRWLRRLDSEAANLRTALDGAVAAGDAGPALRLAGALTWYRFLRGRLAEARRALEAALATGGEVPAAVRAKALAWHAGIALLQGDRTDRVARRDAALRLYRDAGDPGGRARAVWFLAHAWLNIGELAAAAELLDQALAAFRALGDRWGEAAALTIRAKYAHIRGDLAAIARDSERSLELFGVLGDRWGRLQASEWLGGLAEMTGDYERADRLHRDGLHLADELGLWPEVSTRLSWLGWIAMQVGDHRRARECCDRALRLAAEQGFQSGETFAELGLAFTARRAGDIEVAETRLLRLLERALPDDDGPRHGPGGGPRGGPGGCSEKGVDGGSDDRLGRGPGEGPRGGPERGLAEPPGGGSQGGAGGTGEAPFLPMVLCELGYIAECRGDAAAAFGLHARAFGFALAIDARRDAVAAVEGMAGALAVAGHHDHAARLLGAADAGWRSIAMPLPPAERADIDRITARARDALGEARFTAEFELGVGLTLEEARSVAARCEPISVPAGSGA